jgi:competence protein ComEC
MQNFGGSFLKKTPFLRILLPLIAGIIVEFYLQVHPLVSFGCFGFGLVFLLLTKFLTFSKLYGLRWVSGIGVSFIFFSIGSFLVYQKDITHNQNWIGKNYNKSNAVVVTIQEPLVRKAKSYKALATTENVFTKDSSTTVKGEVLVYFQKDSTVPKLKYGSQILIYKSLQPIMNSGNPGGFDYKRYCAFQDIHYQVFLKAGDYKLLQSTKTNWFNQLLINTRSWVLSVLRKQINGKDEVAVAEALLIGYRDDLDRELVQSYSNTGVVHIIAISGLHLGMIYALLLWLLKPLKRKRWNKFLQPVIILFVLWMFTFIAGAAPSIARSAVMFTCIIVGEALSKRTFIHNTLAAAAFILLTWNPFYLWDVGFQLSFAAVLSIVFFSKHINKWFYFRNKLLTWIWSLCSVTLSAQVLTLPLILYHFHQFPNLFLFTNIIIVPLSGVILFAELLLLVTSFIPYVSTFIGRITESLIGTMNSLIERTDRIPFSISDGIQVNIPQSILIYGAVCCAAIWLLQKKKQMMFAALAMMIGFFGLRSIEIIRVNQQQKLIVYNVPQHTAIDVVEGNKYHFIGDSDLRNDGFLRNFLLRPSRIVNRMDEGLLTTLATSNTMIMSNEKKIIILDAPLFYDKPVEKIKADAIIITKNPKLYINQVMKQYNCKLLVFDATNPLWKIRLWKKDCDSLHLRFHSVPEQGAFEMDL